MAASPPRRGAVVRLKGAGYVAARVRATRPPFALILSGTLHRTILAIAGHGSGP